MRLQGRVLSRLRAATMSRVEAVLVELMLVGRSWADVTVVSEAFSDFMRNGKGSK